MTNFATLSANADMDSPVDFLNSCNALWGACISSTGRNIDALKTVLQNAPLLCKNQQVKDNALNLTLRVLLSIKSSQIDAAIEALDDPELCDVLMKYIYRGFEIPSEGSSGHLLTWHEKVFAKGGVGSIVRVLSDSARA